MNEQQTPEHLPPAPFRSWKQLFITVLVIHGLIILSFYFFTLSFHP